MLIKKLRSYIKRRKDFTVKCHEDVFIISFSDSMVDIINENVDDMRYILLNDVFDDDFISQELFDFISKYSMFKINNYKIRKCRI